jgi:ribosomal protein L32
MSSASFMQKYETICAKSENSGEYERPTTICLDYFAACVVFGRWHSYEKK